MPRGRDTFVPITSDRNAYRGPTFNNRTSGDTQQPNGDDNQKCA